MNTQEKIEFINLIREQIMEESSEDFLNVYCFYEKVGEYEKDLNTNFLNTLETNVLDRLVECFKSIAEHGLRYRVNLIQIIKIENMNRCSDCWEGAACDDQCLNKSHPEYCVKKYIQDEILTQKASTLEITLVDDFRKIYLDLIEPWEFFEKRDDEITALHTQHNLRWADPEV